MATTPSYRETWQTCHSEAGQNVSFDDEVPWNVDVIRSFEPPSLIRWLLALLGAITISATAYRLRSLSRGGMIAAILLGTTLVGAAGWWAGALLLAFFVTASLLPRANKGVTIIPAARGNQRDAVQVIVNGGVALICALGYMVTIHSLWLFALAGSLAAANADTWSTEIGRSSSSQPRLITTGKPVSTGTSGAISRRGLLGAATGSTVIGLIAATGVAIDGFATPYQWNQWTAAFAAVTIAGFSGSLLDSLLGATVQEQRWCGTCKTRTEQGIHRCGSPTRHVAGVSWITNDTVNGACALSGAILAGEIVTLLP